MKLQPLSDNSVRFSGLAVLQEPGTMPDDMDTPYSDPRGVEGNAEPGKGSPFITTSLQQAAFLVARGFPITVQLQDGRNADRCKFVFDRTASLLSNVQGFDKKTLAVGYTDYETARKEVCRLIGIAKRAAQ